MKIIDEIIYYFAYGSNMDTVQMNHRCEYARIVGTGYIEGYRLISSHYSKGWKGGVFSIEKTNDINDKVYGVIYDVTPNCIESLDIYEGYPTIYDRKNIDVYHNNSIKKCIVYKSIKSEQIKISKDYYSLCENAAISHNIDLNFK